MQNDPPIAPWPSRRPPFRRLRALQPCPRRSICFARRGFTLLEMLAVVSLAAILSAVAMISLASVARNARTEDVAQQIVNYDRLARDGAQRFGRASRLTFDLRRGTIARFNADDDRLVNSADRPAELHLPSGFHIEKIIWRGGTAAAGEATLPCSAAGQTPTYALRIEGPSQQWQWIVVAGLTGNSVVVNDAQEVEDLFKTLSPSDDAR